MTLNQLRISQTASLIVDGMAILQSIKNVPETFKELAITVFYASVPQRSLAKRIDFVTDTYPPLSIKNPEREKRASHGTVRVNITGSHQKCPKQWKKFLSCGENKRSLVKFILEQWSQDVYAEHIGNKQIYFTIEEKCFLLNAAEGKVICSEVQELSSNHEEADTKLLLHAKHAADHGESSIIIVSPDTDVTILACHFCHEIPGRLFIPKKDRTRSIYLVINAIANNAGPSLCNALPGLHAFTGCDSTSAFSGKGKKAPLKLCQKDQIACSTMASLGSSFNEEQIPFLDCERFLCKLYGKPNLSSVDECRYLMFCAKRCQSQSLPPSKDALTQHTLRANYQAAIWRRALDPNPDVPSPVSNGWDLKDDVLAIKWMSLPPAPEALMELIICGCLGKCSTNQCSCKRNSLSCSDACQCGEACKNPNNFEEDLEEDDSDEPHEENDDDYE